MNELPYLLWGFMSTSDAMGNKSSGVYSRVGEGVGGGSGSVIPALSTRGGVCD